VLTWKVAGRRIGVRVRHSAKVLAVPLVAALTMGAALYPIERFVTSPWLALVAGTVTGIAVYGGLVWLLARDTVLRLRNAARA
jgi:hypothetical protein